MKYIKDTLAQAYKDHHRVCGDHYVCERTDKATLMVLCDGVGSGVYANVAAITCAARLSELMREGRTLRTAAMRVAESMNRARTEEMPFSAFTVLRILPSGHFACYAYENPGPILIRNGTAEALTQTFVALRYEIIAESSGMLAEGDSLLICTDGVTHAGLGGGYAVGWELPGVVQEINSYFVQGGALDRLPFRLLKTVNQISGRAFWDDTSIAMATCRKAKTLTVLTGPPENRADDRRAATMLAEAEGKRAICGSSTAEIAARELGRRVRMLSMDVSFGSPPEYGMDGIDLITEGAVTLNQAMNLLLESIDLTLKDTAVFKLCRLMLEADMVTFLVGKGLNIDQDEDPLLRQLGVKPRSRIVEELAEHLRSVGKGVRIVRV